MKQNKILKLVFCGLLSFGSIDASNKENQNNLLNNISYKELRKMQASLENEKRSRQLKIVEKLRCKKQAIRAAKEKFSKQFNLELINYWLAPQQFDVIQSHQKFLKHLNKDINPFFVIESVLMRDDKIQKTKELQKERLFNNECKKIINDEQYSEPQKDSIFEQMHKSKDQICNNLWLDNMHAMKNKIERQVEAGESKSSFLALPYIKQIHTDRQLESFWNADYKENK
ncbi:MAG: hypothetical protein JO129_04040 [Candidatus Dependentiae bacterium]|nr:hypothetical protein [Candidatus Dependentiae bacterium]